VLEADHADQLAQIAARRYLDGEGVERPLLEPAEVRALSVRRGSLTETERRHIESHVQQTYDFLSLMPWTRQLQDVPAIACAHHEKLDGTGYPRGLQAAEIPLASRMMAIADIYDALTAADRPYKPAVSTGEAIDILTDEARSGKVDADLLDVFARRRIYELTNPDAVGRLDPLVLEALATR
jgi:response regulator RpfG family c-di-GMP phosphodiesterase